MQQIIDWPGIRAAAVVIGVRAAARQAGVNLPPHELIRFTNRVMQRSKREGWLVKREQSKALTIVTHPGAGQQPLPLSANVSTGSKSLLTVLEDHSKRTKMGIAKAATKAAERFARKSGDQIIDQAKELRQIAAAASTVHGWNDKADGGVNLNLGIMIGGMD